jgi:hypothetical protein
MNREELLKGISNRQPVEVKLSFGVAKVMPLTRSQFDHCTELAAKMQKDMTANRAGAVRWYAISQALVDDDGKQILTRDDRDAFDSWSASDTESLFEAILDCSRVSEDDRKVFTGS